MTAQHDWRTKKGTSTQTDRAATRAGALIYRGLNGKGVLGDAITFRAMLSDIAHASCSSGT